MATAHMLTFFKDLADISLEIIKTLKVFKKSKQIFKLIYIKNKFRKF